MTTNHNTQFPAAVRNILSRYTGNTASSELSGQDAYGIFTYLAYLGFSPTRH